MSGDRKKRILWVDDEPTVLMMVSKLLEGFNFEIKTVGSAKEAMAILSEDSNYDLIGTDVRMAECDGLEMSKSIKELYPHLKIIVVSAHASDDAQVLAKEIGVFAYIHKPFKIDELLATINKAIA